MMTRVFLPQLLEHELAFIGETLALIAQAQASLPLHCHQATAEQMHEQQRVAYAQMRVQSEFVRNHGLDSLQALTNRLSSMLAGAAPEASHQPGPRGAGSRELNGGAEGVRAPDPAVQADGAA